MALTIKIGIIQEGKIPSDARAPLTPQQCKLIINSFPNVEIAVQPSPVRCFKDNEYSEQGIELQEDLSDCDILLGVKEVQIHDLIPGKTYLFFSHTIKKQPYNQKLLRAVLDHQIRLIDYEVITDERGVRLIAFGYYAGIVGAHNGLWAYGDRTVQFSLPRMNQCHDYEEVRAIYKQTHFPPVKIVVTGNGRVAAGAMKNLNDMGIRQVSTEDFLAKTFDYPAFTQVTSDKYARRKDGMPFDKSHFHQYGEMYESTFAPYYRHADIFINCIYYDKKAPAFFTVEEMQSPDFRTKVIADISCDIMPGSSVPSTIRASTIADPLYGFNPSTNAECPLHAPEGIDIMAVDNLPSELPRDSSAFFGEQLIKNVLPELIKGRQSAAMIRGMITENGKLGPHFAYLKDYAGE